MTAAAISTLRRRGPDKVPRLTAKARQEALALAAQNMKPQTISRQLGVPFARIRALLAEPGSATFVTEARDAMKVRILASAEGAVTPLSKKLMAAIEDGEAKDVDALARAMSSLERTASSASGEGRKVEVTGGMAVAVGVDVVGEVREFLRGVLGLPALPVVEAEVVR